MKEKPILFSGEMVREILDGRKTQTRRVVTPQPAITFPYHQQAAYFEKLDKPWWIGTSGWESCFEYVCPYGVTGDRLWVRETFGYWGSIWTSEWVVYKADRDKSGITWKPSIFMPRELSRITLEIVDIRVEHLQDITPSDVVAEGVSAYGGSLAPADHWIAAYRTLWDKINAKRGDPKGSYAWDKNPWVWVIEFRRIKPA